MDKKTISALLDWFYHNARNQPDAAHQLSWRKIKSSQDPWAALVSEVMLQQTTVATIAKRFPIFMAQFPTPQKMVAGGITAVLDAWAGLGYYRRAHNLFAAAQMVTEQWHGQWPRTAPEIKKLPGVGDYTARAIAALSFQQKTIPLDGNIIRVLSRFLKKDLSQPTAPAIKKLLAASPSSNEVVGQNKLPSSSETQEHRAGGFRKSIGRTILPSSSVAIGRTILPSSNEVVGRNPLPSSNEVVGRNPLPSSNEVVGRNPLPSSNEVVGQNKLPSSNEVIGQNLLPSSSVAVGQIMLDEIVLPANQLPKNFFMSDWVQAMMDLANLICRVDQPSCDNCPLQAECLGKKKWRDYPQPKIKKTKPIFYGAVLICKNGKGEYMLARRPVNKKNTKPKSDKTTADISAGLYQGLLAFPMTPLVRDPQMRDRQVAKMQQQHVVNQLKNNCVVHDLTHRRLVLSLVFYEKPLADGDARQGKTEGDEMIWVADDELASLPLPSVMKKVIKQMAD